MRKKKSEFVNLIENITFFYPENNRSNLCYDTQLAN